jgi:hypothetical protein
VKWRKHNRSRKSAVKLTGTTVTESDVSTAVPSAGCSTLTDKSKKEIKNSDDVTKQLDYSQTMKSITVAWESV